ncbi:GAP family protein [Streptomyces sp. NPDC058964]|uniref:GAP family protein n=1 Tax=Streptomyces sp. NPDC058964 TaxID=3346681 RepID=UPI0036B7C534
MVVDLLLIALAITLDPLPIMAFVLVVASVRGVWKGLAFILSWLSCLVVVIAIVLALTGGHPPPPKSPPTTAALAAKLAIGVWLVLYGERRRRRLIASRSRGGETVEEPDPDPVPASGTQLTSQMDRTSAWAAAGLAVFLQPWGLVAAAATTVVEADLSHISSWLALSFFCLLATASLLATELYMVFAPTAAKARLLRLRSWMEAHQQQAIVVGSLVVGFWLVGKSIYQLTS